jgi:hypothetical protein
VVPDLLLQRPQDRHRLGILPVRRIERDQIERLELVCHELFDSTQLRLVFRVCFEVPHDFRRYYCGHQ